MHGLIFETSIWLLAGSTRCVLHHRQHMRQWTSVCRRAVRNKVWFCHHTQSNHRLATVTARFQNLRLDTCSRDAMEKQRSPKVPLTAGLRISPTEAYAQVMRSNSHSVKIPHKGQSPKEQKFAPSNAKLNPHGNHDNAGQHGTQPPVNHNAAQKCSHSLFNTRCSQKCSTPAAQKCS